MLGPVTPQDARATELLEFWFGELAGGFADAAHRARWFEVDDDFDDECRRRFGALLTEVAEGAHRTWLDSPRSRLAYILCCDQLSRNIHRGSAAAFATDAQALEAARSGIDVGMDRELGYDERAFLYLPFEHSERIVDQHTCVGLFVALRDETPSGFRHLTGSYLGYAQQHRDIVIRFGRFPHRNAILGRTSTAEEQAFLAGGHDFGQPAPRPAR